MTAKLVNKKHVGLQVSRQYVITLIAILRKYNKRLISGSVALLPGKKTSLFHAFAV